MLEWQNPYNPFNSYKALIWREWFEGMARLDFLPPISTDTDPSNRCNYNCPWCNAFEYMKGKKNDIPSDHLLKLADFYAEWGIKSTCVAGGGEPLMNKGLPQFLERLSQNGVESGVITNGSLITDKIAEVIAKNCRWVGISMDAGGPETYAFAKGLSNNDKSLRQFDVVVKNIEKVTKAVKQFGTKCDVAWKYLLHPKNAHEILNAAIIAKEIGCVHFHMRPVGWDNLLKTKGKDSLNFDDMQGINSQITKAMKLEDEKFQFFGVRHKFQPNFQRKINFTKCWAAPLILTFGADGNCQLCFDMRGRKDLILCRHYPDPKEVLEHWNTDRHKRILQNIDVKKCPRCTFGPYNEYVENIFIKDSMCRNFP
jgi:MoaA/NifB/PqqE/SkfB family radical SAM enzyme